MKKFVTLLAMLAIALVLAVGPPVAAATEYSQIVQIDPSSAVASPDFDIPVEQPEPDTATIPTPMTYESVAVNLTEAYSVHGNLTRTLVFGLSEYTDANKERRIDEPVIINAKKEDPSGFTPLLVR